MENKIVVIMIIFTKKSNCNDHWLIFFAKIWFFYKGSKIAATNDYRKNSNWVPPRIVYPPSFFSSLLKEKLNYIHSSFEFFGSFSFLFFLFIVEYNARVLYDITLTKERYHFHFPFYNKNFNQSKLKENFFLYIVCLQILISK